MENSNRKLIHLTTVGFLILYLVLAAMIADKDIKIKELQYRIESQQKLLDYHNEVLVNINRKVQFPGG